MVGEKVGTVKQEVFVGIVFKVEQHQVDRSRKKPWNFHTQLAVPNGRGENPLSASILKGPLISVIQVW